MGEVVWGHDVKLSIDSAAAKNKACLLCWGLFTLTKAKSQAHKVFEVLPSIEATFPSKFMSVYAMMLRGGEGEGSSLNVIITLSVQNYNWRCSLTPTNFLAIP